MYGNISASEIKSISMPPDEHLTRVATLLNKSIDCPVDVFVIIIEYTGDTYMTKSIDGVDVIRIRTTKLFIERKRTIINRLTTDIIRNKHYTSSLLLLKNE